MIQKANVSFNSAISSMVDAAAAMASARSDTALKALCISGITSMGCSSAVKLSVDIFSPLGRSEIKALKRYRQGLVDAGFQSKEKLVLRGG